jgi:hypothetical protein
VSQDCQELRQLIVDAKTRRNRALVENADAEDEGQALPHTEADLVELRSAIHQAAHAAREAECDIDDIVGPHVGRPDSAP